MIFKSLHNIESAFQLSKLISIVVIIASCLTVGYVVYSTNQSREKEREKIYVLDKGKSLILALAQDMAQNRPVEAKSHIKMFHELFFNLSPDNDAINRNIKRAMYFADKTAYDLFNDMKEKGYYRRIISTNIRQRVIIDSIHLDFENYPYQAVVYGEQIIIRESNITRRHLVTTCNLTNSNRSDNNPHGFLIENFIIANNDEKSTEKRK